jgi:hypothetical protein
MQAISTRYGSRFYRSRTEARWAIFFDRCGVPFEYEYEGLSLPSGPYLPDFWLPTFHMYFEVKGQDPTDEERLKAAELSVACDCPTLIAVGAPDVRFQITWFDQSGEHEGVRYVIGRDRNKGAGFWLVADVDGQSRWFGGGSPGERRFGPMFDPLEPAYEAALSERFERGGTRKYPPVEVEIEGLEYETWKVA